MVVAMGCFVIYMAAHGMDVWAVGETYKWDHGGGDGYGAGPLDAGVFFEGKWMITQTPRDINFMRVMEMMIRVKRARWVQGPSRPGRTSKHPCAV